MGRCKNASRAPRHAAYHLQELGSTLAGAQTAAAAAGCSTAAGQPGEVRKAAAIMPRLAGGADSEEDDEAAEFRREAAELLKHKQRQSALPGGLQQKQLDSAIKHFVGQTSISKQEAQEALLATAEQYCNNFEEWMNEAQVWLAVQGEVQDEAAKLKEAMEVSLREQQAAREAEEAAAPPLVNLSEERLRKRFGGSPVLERLSDVLPGGVLFCDRAPLREQVKHKFVEFLRLEADCLKWWPDAGTKAYFDNLAEKFCEQLSQASTGGNHGSPAAASLAGTAVGTEPTAAQQVANSCAQATGALHLHNTPGMCMAGTSAAGGAAGSSRGAGAMAADMPSASSMLAAGDGVVGTCRQTPEGELPSLSEPSSAAASDGTGGASTELRSSKRKRQPPARFGSPSPASAEPSKKQHLASPDSEPPAKRQPSADSHVAAGGMASLVEQLDSTLADATRPSATGAMAAGGVGAGNLWQQGRDTGQQLCGSLPPSQQQQLGASALPPQQQHQQLQLHAAAAAAACTVLQACMAVRLSQLLADELQQLKHHVFHMPEKACAVPVIFQSVEALQQQDPGDDSDVELVDVKLPQATDSMPEAPESPVSPPLARTHPPPAAAAAAAPAGVAAAAPSAAVGSSAPPHAADMGALLRAYGDAAAAAVLPPAAPAAAGGVMYRPAMTPSSYIQPSMAPSSAAAAPAVGSYAPLDADQWQYRSSTNEQGTLVIEID